MCYMGLLLVILPLLFNLLGDTAEVYFSPTMAHVAQSIPKMRPRFAGVTFVAMGNGAPDLSANISAIRNGSVQLSAGAFTGAAMFVQCVVASEVIRISQGVKCRGATFRDVGTYTVSLLGVMAAFASGTITRWFVVGAVLMYAVYAIWVFCGDEWHARGRPRPELSWSQLRDVLLVQGRLRRGHHHPTQGGSPTAALADGSSPLLPWAAVDLSDAPASAPGAPATSPGHHHHHQQSHGGRAAPGSSTSAPLLDARTYQEAVWADLGSESSLAAAVRGVRAAGRGAGAGELELRATAAGADGAYVPPDTELGEGGEGGAALHRPPPAAPGSPADLPEIRTAGEGDREPAAPAHKTLWQQIRSELTVGAGDEWDELPAVRRRWRAVTYPLLLPLYTLQRITIPFVDPAAYSQQWLVVTMLCSPLGVLLYFEAFSLGALVAAMCIGAVLAGVVHVLTRDEEELPALDLGTSFAFGPALFSLFGFFMGVLWIDTIASEVVGIVALVASLAGIPPSLMGLTLLAWGSSLGDYFGNSALARRGHASTALTACFAGPLFNMLISLALGFSSRFAKEGVSSVKVPLSADVLLGAVFLVVYNIVIAVVGALNHFAVPERFYLFARSWYCLYFVLAVVLSFGE